MAPKSGRAKAPSAHPLRGPCHTWYDYVYTSVFKKNHIDIYDGSFSFDKNDFKSYT